MLITIQKSNADSWYNEHIGESFKVNSFVVNIGNSKEGIVDIDDCIQTQIIKSPQITEVKENPPLCETIVMMGRR